MRGGLRPCSITEILLHPNEEVISVIQREVIIILFY